MEKDIKTSRIAEQETQPLVTIELQGAVLFCDYLQHYNLDALDLALISGVRYTIIYNLQRAIPVSRENIAKVRAGLLRMTQVPFTAHLATLETPHENKQERIQRPTVSHYEEKREGISRPGMSHFDEYPK